MKSTKNKIIFLGCLTLNFSLIVLGMNLTTIPVQAQLMKSVEQSIKSQQKSVDALDQKIQNLDDNYKKLDKALKKELTFREGLKFVLSFEGGLTDDSAIGDPGGLTNLGITHTEYDEYRESKGKSHRSVATISLKEATDIYRHKYWEDSGCSNFTRRLALSCLDWEVNSGRAIQTLQETLGVHVDGLIGHETTNELDAWFAKEDGEDHLLHNYFERRENLYRRWGLGSQAKFLQGWLRRAKTLKDYLKVP